MKTVLLTLSLLCISVTSYSYGYDDSLVGRREWKASRLPMQGSKIVYQEIVNVGAPFSGAQLFKNAVKWHNDNYKSGETRLITEDQEKGMLSGTGVIRYTPTAAGEVKERPIFFNFDIVVSEGSYIYRIYDMYSTSPNGKFEYAEMYSEEQRPASSSKPRWDKRYRYEMLSDMDTYIRLMITHLKQNMQNT